MILAELTQADRDILIRLDQQMDMIYALLTNHLEHHFWYNMTLLGGFIATVTAVGLYLLQQRANQRLQSKKSP